MAYMLEARVICHLGMHHARLVGSWCASLFSAHVVVAPVFIVVVLAASGLVGKVLGTFVLVCPAILPLH